MSRKTLNPLQVALPFSSSWVLRVVCLCPTGTISSTDRTFYVMRRNAVSAAVHSHVREILKHQKSSTENASRLLFFISLKLHTKPVNFIKLPDLGSDPILRDSWTRFGNPFRCDPHRIWAFPLPLVTHSSVKRRRGQSKKWLGSWQSAWTVCSEKEAIRFLHSSWIFKRWVLTSEFCSFGV